VGAYQASEEVIGLVSIEFDVIGPGHRFVVTRR